MSDFSALCPLFNTGVYGCVTFPTITVASISTTTTIGPAVPFGRSVIVTAAYVRRAADISSTVTYTVKLAKMAAWSTKIAGATVFASCKISSTATAYPISRYKAFTVTAKTFSATDLLVVKNSQKETNMTTLDIIVRYKEK
jgi:hypothetical protein